MKTHSQGQNYSGGTIKKAEAKDIILNKLGLGVKDDLEEIGFNTILVELAGADIGIKVDFAEKRFEDSVGIMGNIGI